MFFNPDILAPKRSERSSGLESQSVIEV